MVNMYSEKPRFGDPCTGCGYCCTVMPCQLANDFLNCTSGPCIALEPSDGKLICGLARNPLGYLYKAARPHAEVPVLESAPASAASRELSSQIVSALGIGKGCDSVDDEDSAAWPSRYLQELAQPR